MARVNQTQSIGGDARLGFAGTTCKNHHRTYWDYVANKMRNCFGCRPKQCSFNIANCIVLPIDFFFPKRLGYLERIKSSLAIIQLRVPTQICDTIWGVFATLSNILNTLYRLDAQTVTVTSRASLKLHGQVDTVAPNAY